MNQQNQKSGGSRKLKRGIFVLIGLAVLTGLEFLASQLAAPNIIMWIIAFLKAAAVLYFFMHIVMVFNLRGGARDHTEH